MAEPRLRCMGSYWNCEFPELWLLISVHTEIVIFWPEFFSSGLLYFLIIFYSTRSVISMQKTSDIRSEKNIKNNDTSPPLLVRLSARTPESGGIRFCKSEMWQKQTWVCLFDRFPTVRLVARKVVDIKNVHFYAQHSNQMPADGCRIRSGKNENW